MVTTFLLVTAMLFVVLLVTVLHLPLWLKLIILWTPAWLQAAFVHVVYGGFFIGGVTGHVVGGLLAVPWFFLSLWCLQPLIARQLAEARQAGGWFGNRSWRWRRNAYDQAEPEATVYGSARAFVAGRSR